MPEFAKLAVLSILECSKKGFERSIVNSSTEKMRNQFQDQNVEVDNHSKYNVQLLMYPHRYHSALIAKELEDPSKLDLRDFLKRRVLRNIAGI